ncbi:MAG: glycosyltransferase [Crocinitomicaceae bacterium]|nr:glycosyltransferase [Crocinitomicaceae bacterium]
MNSAPEISIITPVRNGSIYLTECFQSIIKQSFTNFEWIIINDHSTDNTPELLNDFKAHDSRIHVYENQGKGIIDALNTATELARGIFITRMDADDRMPVYKLENLLGLLENQTNTVATGHVKYIENEHLKAGYMRYADWLNLMCDNHLHYRDIFRECPLASPAWMMRKEDFVRIGGFKDLEYPEDYDFAFRCFENSVKIVSTSDVVHEWRDYPERTSRNDPNYADNSFIDLKLRRYFQLFYSLTEPLTVWGAGKKGKEIARKLIEREIEFDWVCDNPNKIGVDIYGKKLKHYSTLKSGQAIIYVTSTEDQETIHEYLENHPDIKFHWFC